MCVCGLVLGFFVLVFLWRFFSFLLDISKMLVSSSLCGTWFCKASSFSPFNTFVAAPVIIINITIITVVIIPLYGCPFLLVSSGAGRNWGQMCFPLGWRWQKRAGSGTAASLPLGDSYHDRTLPFLITFCFARSRLPALTVAGPGGQAPHRLRGEPRARGWAVSRRQQ